MEHKQNEIEGYWCLFCQRFIEADEHGVIVHDEGVDHEYDNFNEERIIQ